MKKVKLITALLIGTVLVSQTSLSSSLIKLIKQGIFQFETEVVDYGTITQHSNGFRTFKFTNTGDAPISISKVVGSCGCTVPTRPEEAILPNETGEIKVKYATDRVGSFTKTVKIFSDASEAIKVVTIKGTVIAPIPNANATGN